MSDLPEPFPGRMDGGDDSAAQGPPAEPRAPDLESLPDEELRALIRQGQEILAAREREKRLKAVREIERLAKEHGIEIELKSGRKRRGRPPKVREG